MVRGTKTALLVVDVQQGLMDQGPWKKARLLESICRLLGAFRSQGAPVIFIRHDDGPGTALAFGGAGWQVAREVAPLRGERVFDKKHNSAFLHTGLGRYLDSLGVGTLVIVGLQTEYCIDATVKSAFEQGYRVVIPAGGVSTFRNHRLPARKINLFFYKYIWQGRFADVLPVEEIIRGVKDGDQ